MDNKVNLGQYFTKSIVWMQDQVIDFIRSVNAKEVLDPFAGDGDLLRAAQILGIKKVRGMDIDSNLGNWDVNDSLVNIKSSNALIITNPPYLAKNSAKRKGLSSYQYFLNNDYTDLYFLALDKCLKSHDYIVAIIPETFFLSDLFKERLESITILEDNPFEDTECPVLVACFTKNNVDDTLVFKNSTYVGTLKSIKTEEKTVSKNIEMSFNVQSGNIGIRGVDGTAKDNKIRFCLPNELNYPLENISSKSRSMTVVNLNTDANINEVILEANKILEEYREKTHDLLLAPFKGNNKANKRRRRLDYKTARAILEEAIINVQKV